MSGNDKKGRGLEDPFKDSSSEQDDGDASLLFYAYARRTDNYWASRYLLTFASAAICNEWWSLVQAEYPSQAVRNGPQLFSFDGDNFPSKLATNKKFEHMKTQWFYAQFGDATGTGGRTQEIIPLQDYAGRVLSGHGAVSDVDGSRRRKGKEKATSGGDNESSGIDLSGLADILHSTQSIIETNNAQIAQLTESQARDQERVERAEKVIEENAQQLRSLTQSHAAAQKQIQALAEQNAKLLRELKKQRTQPPKSEPSPAPAVPAAPTSKTPNGAVSGGGPNETKEACPHDVQPPPRKIDKPLVGYAYDKAKSARMKSNALSTGSAKRPAPPKLESRQ